MTGEKIEQKTEAEYRKVPMLSSSDLRDFVIDRKKFFKEKILGEKEPEDYNKAMLIGNLVHCLLLEPETFDDKFMMSICASPPTANMLVFTESLYRHTVANMTEEGEITADFNELSDLAYIDSGYKIAKETVLKKFTEPNKNTGETAESYYQQLILAKAQGLEVACVDDITIAEKIVKQVKEDEFVSEIFIDTDDAQGFNEIKAEGFDVFGLEMKGMLDRFIVDHKNKTIQLYDLKVTYDPINFKREYWLKKATYIQGYIYWKALLSGILDLKFDYSDYEIFPPIFVAVHSGCFYKPLMYKMSVSALDDAELGFTVNDRYYPGVREIIEDILFAQETGNWTISKKDYDNLGIREI